MRISKEQIKELIKQELTNVVNESEAFGDRSAMSSKPPGRHSGPMEPDEAGVHRGSIDRAESLVGLRIQNLYKEVMRELEYGELKNLGRDGAKKAFYDAASDLRNVQANNAISSVVIEKLRVLEPIANLLEEIGDAIVAFGE